MATPTPTRALVVDDDVGIREPLRQVLEDAGNEVVEAADGGRRSGC